MPKREAVALGIAAIVVAVVLPLCNMLPAGSPLRGLELHPEPLRQVPHLRDPGARARSPVGLRRRALARPRRVLRPRRLRDGNAPHARDRIQERLSERAARLHGVEPGDRAAALLAALSQQRVHARGDRRWCRRCSASPSAILAFRSRIRGVYFSIITQALALSAWLVFNRNEMNLGGTNGLADFKTIFGFPLNQPGTQRGLYVVTALTLIGAYLLCRWITLTRAGKVLVAIRDSETRVLFSGYSPAAYKLFVFVVSAVLAGIAGRALRAAGRHHHAREDRRAALDRDGRVGRRGRARHALRRRPRRVRRELDPELAHHELPRPVAPLPGRALHGRRSCSSRTASSARSAGSARAFADSWPAADRAVSTPSVRSDGPRRDRRPLRRAEQAARAASIIYLEDVTVNYDGFKALSRLNFFMDRRELRVVIGPNGAGKTTLLDVDVRARQAGERPRDLRPQHGPAAASRERDRRARASAASSRRRRCSSISRVRDNVELSLRRRLEGRASPRSSPARRARRARAHRRARWRPCGSPTRPTGKAGALSHGEKQWLEIGMVMAQDPELLLVDEPVAGMTDEETARTGELLESIAADRSVLVIEHDMEFVRQIARKVTVLHQGTVLCEGPVEQVQGDPARPRGVPGARGARGPMLSISGLDVAYGEIAGALGRRPRGADRRAGLPDGTQRRRQDDACSRPRSGSCRRAAGA